MNVIRGNLVGTNQRPENVLVRATKLTPEQQTQARDNIGACSFIEVVDKLCPSFTESGAVVTCEPVEGCPLSMVSTINVKQKGEGTPSPDNIRNFTQCATVNLTRCGRNLFGGEALADKLVSLGATKDTASGTITFTPVSVSGKVLFNKFKENTQYTFVLYGMSVGDSPYTNLRIEYTDGTADAIRFSSGNKAETVIAKSNAGKTVKSLTGYYYGNNIRLYYDRCGVFEGAVTADAFEPYNGDTFTMDLGQSIYGGTLDWATGLLTINWITEEVTKFISVNYAGFANFNTKKKFVYDGTRVYHECSHYPAGKYNSSYPNDYSYAANDNLIVTIDYTRFGTLETANAYLAEQKAAGTPVQICYKLANPTTVQLTPKEIKALAGVNAVYSDTGDTTVSGKADLIAILAKLEAVTASTATQQ